MKKLIVAAAPLEIAPLLEHWDKTMPQGSHHLEIHKDLHVLCTGMGMMNTAAHLTHSCLTYHPDLIIEVGICGSFDRKINIGEVLHVASETYGDFGVEDGDEFKDFFEMGFITTPEDGFQYGKQYPIHTYYSFLQHYNLASVDSVTVNKVHGKDESISALLQKYPAAIENMEGLAVMYVANMLDIPCIAFRSVSNYVEKRNKESWDIPLAVHNLNGVLLSFLDYLK